MNGLSNLTESGSGKLRQSASYLADHTAYVGYVHTLLDRAALPASDVGLPNLTTVASMVEELRCANPTQANLNAVVLGRLLRRLLPNMLSWHGGRHTIHVAGSQSPVVRETTVCRFPMVQCCRIQFEEFMGNDALWSNSLDQWQWVSRGGEE